MMTVKSSSDKFSSVAATVATASFGANIFGTVAAVPFFVLILAVCIGVSVFINVITSTVLIALISIVIMHYYNGCKSKLGKAVI